MGLVQKTAGGIVVKQATARGYIEAVDGDGVSLAFPGSATRRGRVIHQKSHTITCACDICVFYDNVIRHFTVEELEKLQGLPTGYTAAVPEPPTDDWQLTTCPVCGSECWQTDTARRILTLEPDVRTACTACALKGLGK